MPKKLPEEHGTMRGYRQHRRRGEERCEPCLAAERERYRELHPPRPIGPEATVDGENWRPIGGYEGAYEVSDHGRVKSLRRISNGITVPGAILKGGLNRGGYRIVTLAVSPRKAWTVAIHRLVAEAFIGPRPDGHDVRHLDGNPANNRLSNLAYGTKTENEADKFRHGTHFQASKTHCPKGHEYTPDNIYWGKGVHVQRRQCRKCHIAWSVAYKQRRRAAKRLSQAAEESAA